MRIVRSTESRRSETPAAVMTTFASPDLGGAAAPVWKVEAAAGTAGPVHHIDAEQVWTVLAGTVAVTVGEDSAELAAGDTVVIAADAARQFTPGQGGFTAICTGPAGMRAYMPGKENAKMTPPWTA
ncbi:cupin domain-containing protein [Glycomyces niveus]|uniref:Cupin domain-containing protein n=1 Tax=Glycomyces niveus TaxID=2820287 RepID=A0ABS3U0F9_9ACTN|nr:cupin domain-containing protein [Glycomyces sp. NEAU-S30]MBO3732253.1 cupin domain-containing protein [Glycomyces sp. NEAU-S30]